MHKLKIKYSSIVKCDPPIFHLICSSYPVYVYIPMRAFTVRAWSELTGGRLVPSKPQ